MENCTILATGGCGYIGSHVVVDLLRAGANVVVLDDFSNSKPAVLQRVKQLTNRDVALIRGDIRDRSALAQVFAEHKIDLVVHFAGLKAVGESVEQPWAYYDVNVNGSMMLFEAMAQAGCKRLVFSSSATVYGDPENCPIDETAALQPSSPYGRTKLMVEQIIGDMARADPEWAAICLRYFNPVGAHQSGQMGEDPSGIPNNLFPYISQVAVGKRDQLTVFGDDFPTRDGTGVRDYIHVSDLSEGHLAALRYVNAPRPELDRCLHINLGTGNGYSVFEALEAFSRVVGRELPRKIGPRRAGDVAECYASVDRAKDVLNWKATRDLDEMCADAWRWQSQNPSGYPDDE